MVNLGHVWGSVFTERFKGGICKLFLVAESGDKIPNLRKPQIEIKYTHFSVYNVYNCTKIHKLFD
jgi:hypothetical protein